MPDQTAQELRACRRANLRRCGELRLGLLVRESETRQGGLLCHSSSVWRRLELGSKIDSKEGCAPVGQPSRVSVANRGHSRRPGNAMRLQGLRYLLRELRCESFQLGAPGCFRTTPSPRVSAEKTTHIASNDSPPKPQCVTPSRNTPECSATANECTPLWVTKLPPSHIRPPSRSSRGLTERKSQPEGRSRKP